MLKLDPASRRRLVAGTASVALMAAAGLALTASGTGAAAAVRAVQEVLPPAVPAVPTPPAAPATVPTPPTPSKAPAPPKAPRKVTVVTTRDGRQQVRTYAGNEPLPPEAARALATMPLVRSGECRTTDTSRTTEVIEEGGRRITVICRRHIEAMARRNAEAARHGEAMARHGEVMAHQGEVMAGPGQGMVAFLKMPQVHLDSLRLAQMNLRGARRNVERAEMPEDARREALAGIDQGLREIEENIRSTK